MDEDNDGIPDIQEVFTGDHDSDGLVDLYDMENENNGGLNEGLALSLPNTDGDGQMDYVE